jgi:hypothetical protein
MKKTLVIFLIIIFIVGAFFSCKDDAETGSDEKQKTEKFMETGIISSDEYMVICSENDLTSVNMVENLLFNGNLVPYDNNENTYYITLSVSDKWDKGKLTQDNSNVSIYFIESDYLDMTKAEAISSGKHYKLFAFDSLNYILCNIVFTYMPVMTIDNNDTVYDYDYPITAADTKAKMTLTGIGSREESDIIIHTRGGSSGMFPKTGYKMNLVSDGKQNNLNLLDMREDDDWVLLAIYTDESKIRDRMVQELWSSFAAKNNDYGINNGSQIKYIELILNGRYWGLYGLVVPVDKKQQDLNDKKGEILCKTESWDIPSSDKLRKAGQADTVDSIVIKSPQVPNQANWNVVADLVELIFESDDKTFADNIASAVDIDNVIDYWIMINVTSCDDNSWKNMYITFKQKNDGYTALVCPWDCDLSLGVTWDENAALFWQYKEKELTELIGAGNLPNRILNLNVNGAQKKLQTCWKALRQDILSNEALTKQVDTLTDEIKNSGTWDREVIRWPSGGHVLDDNTYIKNFISKRMIFLDNYIAEFNQ